MLAVERCGGSGRDGDGGDEKERQRNVTMMEIK